MVSQLCFPDFFFRVRSAITIGAGGIGAPLVLADYKQDDRVWCASPIFLLIAYCLGFTNRKRKYVEEKTTVTLKSKQTSNATVRKHILTAVSLPTPLIFRLKLFSAFRFTPEYFRL
jgi:hypothetical protein